MEKERNEDSIDISKLFGIIFDRKKLAAKVVGGCTVLALIISLILPPTYESTTLVQTRNAAGNIGAAAAAMAALGIGGTASTSGTPTSYIELMKSRAVLEPVIAALDRPEEEKEGMTAAGFAKSALDIKNTKGTNLITVTAKGNTPEEAQQISQAVVDNFLVLMTNMNQNTQSLLVKFLDERIAKAKEESEAASNKLADYSREHKIYAPDEQVRAAVERLEAYDTEISEQEVAAQASEVELAAANAQLGVQEASSRAYSVADNDAVTSIRQQIVNKRVELVSAEQKYTDNHPTVQRIKQELSQLESSLDTEVGALVASRTATISPAQSALLQRQVMAVVSGRVAKASADALRAEKEKKQKDTDLLPEEILVYTQLASEAKIKVGIYETLVAQCEDTKIKEAMESMDIQVVDPADLPKGPSGPRRKLITAIGFVIGVMLVFGYSLVIYKREN